MKPWQPMICFASLLHNTPDYSLALLLSYDKAILDKLCEALELEKFSDIEIRFLTEYIKVLKPVAVALDKLQVLMVWNISHLEKER